MRSRTAKALSAYYVATGAAPFLSRRAFEAVTGPKSEWWLVQTVALLSLSIGSAAALADRNERLTPELGWLSAAAAASFAGIDLVHVARGRIRVTYLVDAAAQLALLAAVVRDARDGSERA